MQVFLNIYYLPSIFVLLKYQDPFIEHGPVIKENTARVVAACQNHLLLLWRTILNHTLYTMQCD